MTETTLNDIHALVLKEQGLLELEYYKFYPIKKKLFVETPDGEAQITEFVRKHGKKCEVTFDAGQIVTCIDIHQFIGLDGERRKLHELKVGDEVLSETGPVTITSITCFDEEIDVFDITVGDEKHLFKTADGLFHHNTGKTQTIEDTLQSHGLVDGNGFFKITGSASAIGIYSMLYKNRNGIVVFDDCDGALDTQDGRNVIKAATDTKKIRKVAWGKKSAGMYDPEDEPERDADAEGEDIEDDRLPKYFQFTGRVIFISNLPLNKLDPDGALRTRAFVISVDPTPEEIFGRMEEILGSIKLESGTLSDKERQNVLEVVKTSRRAKDASLRTLVRALNLAASGAPNWASLVKLYA